MNLENWTGKNATGTLLSTGLIEGDEEKFKTLDRIDYAYFALALIDNLNTVDVNYQTFNYQLTMDDANMMVGGNIKDYGSSSEKLKELYGYIEPKRLILLS